MGGGWIATRPVEDSLAIDYIAKAYPDLLEALPEVYSSDAICFGVRKGNPDFLRWLDLFASPALTPVW